MRGSYFRDVRIFLYCSVLSLGRNENTRRMSNPDMVSIFHIKKSMKYSGHRKLLCEFSKLSKLNDFILFYQLTFLALVPWIVWSNRIQFEIAQIYDIGVQEWWKAHHCTTFSSAPQKTSQLTIVSFHQTFFFRSLSFLRYFFIPFSVMP